MKQSFIQFLLKYSLLNAFGWTLLIFILCSTPGQYIPTTNWLELLSFDKFVHASIFCVLINLWLIHHKKLNKYTNPFILITLLVAISYGGLLEIMQAKVFSNRSGDWLDFIANTFGCLVGIYLFRKIILKKISIET